jgi:hypothetical protein
VFERMIINLFSSVAHESRDQYKQCTFRLMKIRDDGVTALKLKSGRYKQG